MFIKKYKLLIQKIKTNIPYNKSVNNIIAKEIYGTIIVMALIGYFSFELTHPLQDIYKILCTVFAFAVVEVYAEYMGLKVSKMRSLKAAELKTLLMECFEIVMAAVVPCIFLLLSYLGLFSVGIAYILSLIFGFLSLFFYGVISGTIAGYTTVGIIISGLTSTLFGFIAVICKYALH